MKLNDHFDEVFGKKPVYWLIYLAGKNSVRRALDELEIYAEESVNGAIIVKSIKCAGCDCVNVINKKYLNEWNQNVTSHENDYCDFVCEPCMDFDVTESPCVNNVCEKIFIK